MVAFPLQAGSGQRASDRLAPAPPQPRMDHELATAIADDAVVLHFQPQIAVSSGKVVGVEALARWDGAAGPEDLFNRAAASNLSERLSRAVQRKALRLAGQWTGALARLRLSINLLAEDLERPGYERWLLDEIAAVTPALPI